MADEPTMTRAALLSAAAAGAVLLVVKPGGAEVPQTIEVTPNEDLMREHGVLRRIAFLYDEAASRLEAAKDLPLETLEKAIGLHRRFIQKYHENLEEVYVFPKFEKAGVLADLTKVLHEQHKAGRALTDECLALVKSGAKAADDRTRLARSLRLFVRMYRVHAAREDTVLFPAVRRVMTPKDYDAMGDTFEDKEQELFGKDGFEKIVGEVAALEKTLGLADLASFTPPA